MLPILLLFYNRLDTLEKVLDCIRLYKPSKLFLSSDGPKLNNIDEHIKINNIRNTVLRFIDWDCEIYTLFHPTNLGCQNAVDSGIKWFFSNVDYGIVLEDDIIPTQNFFKYCEDNLFTHANNMNIGAICGRNELECWGNNDIFLSNTFSCWGWASWSNRIVNIDVKYGENQASNYAKLYKGLSWYERCYIDSALGLLQTKQVDSWAYPYDLNFRKDNRFHIYPKKNLIKNIGYGIMGTHSLSYKKDKVKQFHDFIPKNIHRLEIDKKFTISKILKDNGGKIRLIVLRYSRYLKIIKNIIFKIKKVLYRENFNNN